MAADVSGLPDKNTVLQQLIVSGGDIRHIYALATAKRIKKIKTLGRSQRIAATAWLSAGSNQDAKRKEKVNL